MKKQSDRIIEKMAHCKISHTVINCKTENVISVNPFYHNENDTMEKLLLEETRTNKDKNAQPGENNSCFLPFLYLSYQASSNI